MMMTRYDKKFVVADETTLLQKASAAIVSDNVMINMISPSQDLRSAMGIKNLNS